VVPVVTEGARGLRARLDDGLPVVDVSRGFGSGAPAINVDGMLAGARGAEAFAEAFLASAERHPRPEPADRVVLLRRAAGAAPPVAGHHARVRRAAVHRGLRGARRPTAPRRRVGLPENAKKRKKQRQSKGRAAMGSHARPDTRILFE
jgi:hypothetical protein